MVRKVNLPGQYSLNGYERRQIISLMNQLHKTYERLDSNKKMRSLLKDLESFAVVMQKKDGKDHYAGLLLVIDDLRKKIDDNDELAPYDLMDLLSTFLNGSIVESNSKYIKTA